MARNWINCDHCGKRAFVLVGSAFCSRVCLKKYHREQERQRRGTKPRKKLQTEAAKYREKMGEVRL